MWLALDCATRPGSPASLSVEKKVVGAAPFYWSAVDSLLKESLGLGHFSCIITTCAAFPSGFRATVAAVAPVPEDVLAGGRTEFALRLGDVRPGPVSTAARQSRSHRAELPERDQGLPTERGHDTSGPPLNDLAPGLPSYLLGCARGQQGPGSGSPVVPAWLIAPCSWYGLGGVATGTAGA
jgi:hypothetical protein